MDLTRRLKLTHLKLILKIAEVGQIQIAAGALAMSQPAASRILAEIERETGAQLFHRTPKGMEPTPIGEAFIRHARVVLSELDSLEKEVQGLSTGQAGEVRIGSVTGPAVGVLMPVVQEVRAQAPETAITIEVSPSADLVRGLEEGRFDFIIARIPDLSDSRDFLVHPARTEVVKFLTRKTHPLASAKAIDLADLLCFDWVIQERGSPIRQAVETAFHNAGHPTPPRVINSSSMLIVQALLSSTDAIAPQSREVAELMTSDAVGANLTVLDLAGTITVSPYFVIRHHTRQLGQAAERLYQRVLENL
ncbi:LysR family transcriptional regulator [Tropicibacter naphthalenivorans]|uniref:Galactose-binding protein regulator n=1 Tax=Tropicibacter naphthalenivorans TaxID=441103 RepID=A0A0N7M0Q2_9RHOB|nr:LysR family transcriptional regulator [Tropicibacter naphthalenivorans]CUH81097.1 Galactose-binding protein regulator [Tropicibacter naphthalenivorans]SMC97155.1 DNA-binding transcriptional regulator, LysR family [Tropicibacter naphthalenivorans]